MIKLRMATKGVKSFERIFRNAEESFIIFSEFSFAKLFGRTSPKMITATVVTAVATPTALAPRSSMKNTVVREDARIFTMLFAISRVERVLS